MLDQQSLYGLWDVLHDSVLVVDAETLQILYANRAAQIITGYDLIELTILTLFNLFPEGEHDRLKSWHEHDTPPPEARYRQSILPRDGPPLPVETRVTQAELHDTRCLVCVLREMTACTEQTHEVSHPDHLNQKIVQEAPIGIVTFDVHGRVTLLNPTQARFNGIDPKQFIGTRLLDDHSVIAQNDLLVELRGVLKGMPFTKIAPYFATHTGNTIAVKIYGVPLRDPAGSITGGMLLIDNISEHITMKRQFYSLFRSIPDLLFRMDKQGTYLDFQASDELQPLIPPPQFLGKTIDSIGLPDDIAQASLNTIQRVLETHKSESLEYDYPGNPHSTYFEARFIPNGQDEVLVVIRDITQNKLNQRELATSEARYSTLIQAIPDLLFRIRRDGLYLDAKIPKGLGIVELEPEAIIGHNVRDVVPPHVTETVMPVIRQVLDTRQKDTVEYSIEEPSGPHYYEARFVPNTEDDVLAIVRDITPNKQIEKALRESEETARTLMNAPRHIAILINMQWKILAINDLGAHVLGGSPEELIGTPIFDIIDPDLGEIYGQQGRQVIESKKPMHFEHEHEDKIFSSSIYPLFNDTGIVTRLAVLTHDITTKKQNERALRRHSRLLKGVADATNQLLAGQDHDAAISKALATLGTAAEADWVYILENVPDAHEPGIRYQAGWTKNSLSPDSIFADNLTWRTLGHWHDKLVHGEAVSGPLQLHSLLADIGVRSFMTVPIFISTQFWGCISVNDLHTERIWTSDEISALRTMAASVGAAFERQQTEQRLKARRTQANTLREIGVALNSTLNRDEVLSLILDQAWSVIPYDAANIMLIENNVARIVLNKGYGTFNVTDDILQKIDFDIDKTPILQAILQTHTPYVCPDVEADPKWIVTEGGSWIKSWLGAPIILRNGEVVGFFSLDSEKKNFYNPEHIEWIDMFVRQAAIAFENAYLYEQTEANYEQVKTLHEAGKSILLTLDLNEILEHFACQMTELADATSTIICNFDPASHSAIAQISYHRTDVKSYEKVLTAGERIQFNTPKLRQAIAQKKTLVLTAHELADQMPDNRCLDHICTVIIVPLHNKDRITGVAIIRDSRPEHQHSQEQIAVCEALANLAAIAIEQASLFTEVQELERIKSEMIRMASHDLRGPLTRLRNQINEVNLIECHPHHDMYDYLARIHGSVDEMEQIISNILSLERIEARYREAEPVIWVNSIHHAVETLAEEAAQKHLRILIDCMPDLPLIHGDPPQIEHAIANLLSNAIKYSRPGTEITIRAYLKDYGGQPNVAIEVEDNGIGIPFDQQESLFQPFFRAQNAEAEQIPGIGLGLSVVKAAVEYHKGKVYVDSVPGEGSLFGFRVPV